MAAARANPPDLVVLDVMLPGFDGTEVCRQLRTFTDAYVIMLTVRDEEVDKIAGLSVGADDYLVKSFLPRELVARIRAMLRRPRAVAGAMAGEAEPDVAPDVFGALSIDAVARIVLVSGEPVEATRTELDLPAALAARPRAAFTRRQLLDAVWGDGWYGDEHVDDVHIGHLRRALGHDADNPRYVRTVRGVGYGMGSG